MKRSELAEALWGSVRGDLKSFALIKQNPHSELLKAGEELGELVLERVALRNVLEKWREHQASDGQVQAWASFMMRGYLDPGKNPIMPLNISYEGEFEELIAFTIHRLEELGDLVDGEITRRELDEMISALS